MATVGLDIGGFSSKVCVSWSGSDSIELHVNRVSNRETPTIVAFDKRKRIYGEEADLRSSSLYATSFYILPYVVNVTKCEFEHFVKKRKYLFTPPMEGSCSEPGFEFEFDDQVVYADPRDMYSFFVNSLVDTVRKHMGLNHPRANTDIVLSVSVPNYFRKSQRRSIYRSLVAWGYSEVHLYKQTDCTFTRWCDSHLPDVFDEFEKATSQTTMHVGFLDVGYCHSTFFVGEITKGETLEKRILAEESSDEVGTYHMIELLADHVCSSIKESKKERIEIPSRQSFNIFKSCSKALKELSVVTDVKIDCERVLADGEDFSTVVTRTQFEELCLPLKEKLETMMNTVLEQVPAGSMLAIEVLGGGCRVPFVKNLATEIATKREATQVVRMSMDSTSAVANGAVALSKSGTTPLLDPETEFLEMSDDVLSKAIEREETFAKVEREEFQKLAALNEIDQYIIQTKNHANGEYKEHVKLEEVENILTELEEFSSSAANNKVILSSHCEEKLNECRQKIAEACPEYVSAMEAADKARQDEIAKANQESQEYTLSKVNMDVTLPRATCLKRAAKNKEEGNSLVAGGNIEIAIQHYIKALQYCSKVKDATEEERPPLDALKLACHLNLAMCYIKMATPKFYEKAIGSCDKALEISADNPKALYRRSFCYDKLNQLDYALIDAREGVAKHPSNSELKQRDALYISKVERLTRKLKKALFFAHTASRSHGFQEAALSDPDGDANEWLPAASTDVEAVVRTAHYCQKQLEQLKNEKDLRVKTAALQDALVLLDDVSG
ncbi:tetratricopeptide repeat-containing protein [Babesia ovis]|uniref:Tetratricopeptide repeat-containing protein n=1 Tax=Babesia ovis TaxID=5869 RepID=A0A9W5TF93_BABOV|nr:tetratricopeptide repeat-containing protein [Babesia ovis]